MEVDTAMENQEKARMTFLFVGDVMLGRLVNAVLQRKSTCLSMGRHIIAVS